MSNKISQLKFPQGDLYDIAVEWANVRTKPIPTTGNASASQIVMGNDTRLTDARNANDVYAWAKEATKPTYTKDEIGLGNVDNTSDANKPISTATQNALNTKANWGIKLSDYLIQDGATKDELSASATTLDTKIDAQDEKIANAVGLIVTTGTDSNEYQYASENEMLVECHTASASIDKLATELKACFELIEKMKSNIYMIEVDFKATPNSDFTTENVSFSLTYNDEPTSPSGTVITKIVNDTKETVLFNGTSQSSSAFTSTIEGAKEYFQLVAYPNSTAGVAAKSELFRYLCYVGKSNKSVIDVSTYRLFDKNVSDGTSFEKSVSTSAGEYVWIVVPKQLQVVSVTNNGMTFSLAQPQEITDNVTVEDVVNHVASGETQWWIDYDSFYDPETTIDNPEFTKVVLDSEDKIVYGERVDGSIYNPDMSPYVLKEGLGTFNAYRSLQQLDTADWDLVINNLA